MAPPLYLSARRPDGVSTANGVWNGHGASRCAAETPFGGERTVLGRRDGV
jgi:hypothetical protein